MKSDNQLEKKDIDLFQSLPTNCSDSFSKEVIKTLPRMISKDLVASKSKLGMVYVLGSVIGYLLSLAICAQFAIGLSPLSWQTAAYLHKLPDPWCAILCGAVFGVAPVITSFVTLSRFQHRFLLFQMWWLVALVPAIASFSMTLVGFQHEFLWQMIWFFTAVAMPYACEVVARFSLRQRAWE